MKFTRMISLLLIFVIAAALASGCGKAHDESQNYIRDNSEEKIEKLESDILKFATDFVKLREITEEKEQTELLLEEKMERWMYLEDLAKKIAEQ